MAGGPFHPDTPGPWKESRKIRSAAPIHSEEFSGQARFITNSGGILDISNLTSGGTTDFSSFAFTPNQSAAANLLDAVQLDGNAQGYNFTTGGVSLGLDYRITDQLAIGVMGEYSHTWTDLNPGGHIDVDSGRGGVYATWFSHGIYSNGAIYGGHNNYDSGRDGLGGLASTGGYRRLTPRFLPVYDLTEIDTGCATQAADRRRICHPTQSRFNEKTLFVKKKYRNSEGLSLLSR